MKSKMPSVDARDAKRQLSREKLIQALALALLIDEQTGIAMAGVEPAKFVQTARRVVNLDARIPYKFTDEDLREVHWHLRRHVATLARTRKLPVLDIINGKIRDLRVH